MKQTKSENTVKMGGAISPHPNRCFSTAHLTRKSPDSVRNLPDFCWGVRFGRGFKALSRWVSRHTYSNWKVHGTVPTCWFMSVQMDPDHQPTKIGIGKPSVLTLRHLEMKNTMGTQQPMLGSHGNSWRLFFHPPRKWVTKKWVITNP